MATKPTRLQAKQIYALINGVPSRRVQSFDWNSNFTVDSVYELGNDGIVEDTVSLVETNITMNSNEWGTTDLEAMVYNQYAIRNIGAKTAGATTNTTVTLLISTRGAGGKWDAIATLDWLQVIRWNKTGTVNDTEYVKIRKHKWAATGATGGKGVHKIRLSPTYCLTAAATKGDMVCKINDYTITADTIDASPCHIILPHRYSTAATTILHSILIPRCYVDNLTYNFDVDGTAEQNYTLVGEEEIMLLGSRREAFVTFGSFCSYTSATLTFTVPKQSLAATGSPYMVYADSEVKRDLSSTGVITKTANACTVQVRMGSGLGITSAAQIAYYHTNKVKRGYKKITNIDSSIGKLTKGYIEVWMQVGSGTNEQLSRCSGVSYGIPQTRESIDEFGESRSIAKPLEGNLRNEITLTFTRNDLREYAKLLGYESTFDAGTLKEILMTSLKSVNTVTIIIKLYASQTTHDATTLLKTFTMANCSFIGQSSTTPISGSSGLDLQFSTQSVNIAGSGLPPKYIA